MLGTGLWGCEGGEETLPVHVWEVVRFNLQGHFMESGLGDAQGQG